MSQHGFMIVLALAAATLLLGRKLLLVLFAILMAVFFMGLYNVVEFMHRLGKIDQVAVAPYCSAADSRDGVILAADRRTTARSA